MRLRAISRLAAIFLFFSTLFAWAEQPSQLKPTDYVNDFAHVLDQATVREMDNICQQVDEKAHAQIALVTINTLEGSDIESFAVDLYKQWGIGSKSTNRGVLILYAIQDRRARIEVGYGLEPILPDGKVGGFQREAIPLMRQGDYNQALLLVTVRVADVIAGDAGVEITHALPRAPTERVSRPEGDGPSLGGIVVIIIIIVIVMATPLRGIVFWLLLSNLFGGRRGGWGGGGGFGGFGGGGGGFGGFGGGSSGGGGASSSW